MPRVSREQTDANRAAIEDASARLIREHGPDGVSVAGVMAAAGLTHGGFYGHFASKDELAAVACARAFEQSAARWVERVDGQPDGAAALTALVDGYLSTQSRAAPGSACPAAALAGDVARETADKPIRAAYLDGVKGQVAFLETLQGPGESDPGRALSQLSTLIGALVLSRATRGDPISDALLAAARDRLVPATALPKKIRKSR